MDSLGAHFIVVVHCEINTGKCLNQHVCSLRKAHNGFPIVITHKLSKEETTTSGERRRR